MKNIRSIALFIMTIGFVANAQSINSPAISSAISEISALSKFEGEESVIFSVTKVKGFSAEEMLADYANQSGYDISETKILLKMKSEDIPETDGGDSVVGLARNVDVVSIGTYVVSAGDQLDSKLIENKLLGLLFNITKAGGLVGVESHGWSTCGVTFPSVIILDMNKKVVYSLRPANTDC